MVALAILPYTFRLALTHGGSRANLWRKAHRLQRRPWGYEEQTQQTHI
jgi:hypothetical protein